MRKRLFKQALTMLLTAAVISGNTLQPVLAVTEDDIETIVVSENDTDTAEDDKTVSDNDYGLGQYGHDKDFIEEQRKKYNATDFYEIPYQDNGTWGYDQTFARTKLLPALNAARMDEKNWWYLADDNTTKVRTTVTKPYEYDCELEAYAMQRAADLVLNYTHKRMNGMPPQEILEEQGSRYQWVSNYNELIGFGPMTTSTSKGEIVQFDSSAEGIVYGFMEEYGAKAGEQAHRRAILTDSYYRIGIGVVKLKDGTRFVAIEIAEDHYETPMYDGIAGDVSYKIPVSKETPLVNGYKETYVSIATNKEFCKGRYIFLQINADSERRLLDLYPGHTYNLNDAWFGQNQESSRSFALCTGDDAYFFKNGWVSEDPSVATVDNGVITAIAAGQTKIVSYDEDGCKMASVDVIVPKPRLTSISAEYPLGSAPVGTVIWGDDILITKYFTYGDPQTDFYDLGSGICKFTVEKEGVNTFTFETEGKSCTFTVTGTVEEDGDDEDEGETQKTDKHSDRRITVAKKFRKICTVKRKELRRKSKTFKLGAKVMVGTVLGAGTVSYKVTKCPKKAKRYIKVNKRGVVTFRKGAKKGIYKIKITAKAIPGMYGKVTKTVTFRVK